MYGRPSRCPVLAMFMLLAPLGETFTREITPDDELVSYSGYVRLFLDPERARFDRRFGSKVESLDSMGFSSVMGSGARMSWRTAAERVTLYLDYRDMGNMKCNENCVIDESKSACYKGGPKRRDGQTTQCVDCEICYNQCQVGILRDGVPIPGAGVLVDGDYDGQIELKLMDQSAPEEHEYTAVMPWGAKVDFMGLILSSDVSQPTLLAPPARKLRYIAYGDSITQGWCGRSNPYAETIAQIHGFEAVNMGVQGLTAAFGATAGHGTAIGQLSPDLVTMMLGTSDLKAGSSPDKIAVDIGSIIRGLRAEAPTVAIVVITPISVAWSHMALEPVRVALRNLVRRHMEKDPRLFLVEGKPLVAPKYMYHDGVHLTSAGAAELANNLNAEMGFSRVSFSLQSCAPPVLALSGLTPMRPFIVYYGAVPLTESELTPSPGPDCSAKSLMLKPEGKDFGMADRSGKAIFTVPTHGRSCKAIAWQVLDVHSCMLSRRGSHLENNSTVHTVAPLFPSLQLSPPPPTAPPSFPPSAPPQVPPLSPPLSPLPSQPPPCFPPASPLPPGGPPPKCPPPDPPLPTPPPPYPYQPAPAPPPANIRAAVGIGVGMASSCIALVMAIRMCWASLCEGDGRRRFKVDRPSARTRKGHQALRQVDDITVDGGMDQCDAVAADSASDLAEEHDDDTTEYRL